MTLVDSSVWIGHFRAADPKLIGLLEEGEVLIHAHVLGELACGSLKDRSTVLDYLGRLPFSVIAREEEVLHLIENGSLYGRGLGWTDCHLLASARLSHCALWTKDRPLASVAEALGIPRP